MVIADELDRTLLMAMFHQDGYRCLFEANSLIQALEVHRRQPLDLWWWTRPWPATGPWRSSTPSAARACPRRPPWWSSSASPRSGSPSPPRPGGVNLVAQHPVDFPGALKFPMEELLGLV